MSRAARCVACGAPVVWAATVKGRRMPLDPEPIYGGNIALNGAGVALVVPAKPDQRALVAHFTTCPHADRLRKRDRR